jgi:hypothetical protein
MLAGGDVKERIEINRELGSHTICIATDDPGSRTRNENLATLRRSRLWAGI